MGDIVELDGLVKIVNDGGLMAVLVILIFFVFKNGRTILEVLNMFKERPDYSKHLKDIAEALKQREKDILTIKEDIAKIKQDICKEN